MTIEVYTFKDSNGNSTDSFTTQNIYEARQYAQANQYAIVALIFEYADSELIEDYRPRKRRQHS
jgi:hypothetical protein